MTNEEEERKNRIKRLIDSEAETRPESPVDPTAGESADPAGTTKAQTPKRTPTASQPAHIPLDQDNMPLPRRVNEVDMDGTRVTPVAYEPTSRPRNGAPLNRQPTYPPLNPPLAPPSQPPPSTRPASSAWRPEYNSCLVRTMIVALFSVVILMLMGGSVLLFSYYSIARTLPSVEDLQNRASQFETTRILDRNGNLLYEILDPSAGRRTYVPLNQISPALIAATIATEDKDFYEHPGFDPLAIIRALWENYRTGGQGGGASTITQQLARALLLTPEERAQRTYSRKAREIILAAEITRRYSKDEILELYLNEIYYGNLAYGIEAASETYFGKAANQLTLSEASFLAGLPQSPSVYDIYTNRDVTLGRQQQVLVLMFGLSQVDGCIKVSNSEVPICVDEVAAANAANEMKTRVFNSPNINTRYPHWVNFVREQLEEQYDAQTIYRSGFNVYTTLDPVLQDEAQRLVTEQVATLVDKNAHNGALVSIRPSTGEILAMVGSPDFNNEAISGQINMADSSTRQPGSSIKPINYVAAFEKGWTPATLIWDVPSEFPPSGNPEDPRAPYVPVNYDGRSHGPVTLRTALANSFNIPAVKTLDFVGIYDDPNTPQKDGMVGMAERLGITSFTRPDYGLSLTLGGGDVSLLDMTSAYSVLANYGKKVPPVAILTIVDFQGNVVYEYQPPQAEQVIRAEHAFLMSSILSDNEARAWMFGRNSLLNLPFQVAAKTGTTNDFRDNWTLGYTPDLVTGVWVGNADYTPMVNTTGLTGAAPIWSSFMQYAVPYVSNNIPTPFTIPPGIVEYVICAASGTEPSQGCRGGQRNEYFASDQPPLPRSQDLIRRLAIDTWTGLIAGDACKDFADEEMVLNVQDKWARQWLRSGEGREWLEANDLPRNPFYAPERECSSTDPRPVLEFQNPTHGSTVTETSLPISGVIDVKNGGFSGWRLEYGLGDDPSEWTVLTQGNNSFPQPGLIHTWDLTNVAGNLITLRLYLMNGEDFYAEKRVMFGLNLPTPTPTPTLSPTAIPPTAFPTDTSVPVVDTPTETSTPPPPSSTPTETPTTTPES
ncbi:MAG TPA: transglycosylase domain-containing protein [Anaerolineales bacterium]|nr:transglycosylase domain-containing protein [Anaerolineales bacterium]